MTQNLFLESGLLDDCMMLRCVLSAVYYRTKVVTGHKRLAKSEIELCPVHHV